MFDDRNRSSVSSGATALPMANVSSPSIAKSARTFLRFMTEQRKSLSPLLILTHDFPDPDALASGFAFYHIARNILNINARLVYGGIIGRTENKEMVRILKIPVHKFHPRDFSRFPYVALVDTQPEFENNPFPATWQAAVVIDQHPSLNHSSSRLSIVDDTCGATSVILAQALLSLREEIPKRIATALAYGIITDTLNLFRAKRDEIIGIYKAVLPFCDMRALARMQNPTRSRRFFITLKRGIQSATIRQRVVVSHLGEVENPDLVSQVADFLLSFRGTRWALCTGRYHDRLYVSLRAANSKARAATVLRDIVNDPKEAGGHETIAGGSMYVGRNMQKSSWEAVEESLVRKLICRLHLPAECEPSYPFR